MVGSRRIVLLWVSGAAVGAFATAMATAGTPPTAAAPPPGSASPASAMPTATGSNRSNGSNGNAGNDEACPDPDLVWASATALVPSEAATLLAAKPRVEIVDLGMRYRVRVSTDGGLLERTYTDASRDCTARIRFAAEFIVVALLPPQLALLLGGEDGGAPRALAGATTATTAPSAVQAPTTPSAPPPAPSAAPARGNGPTEVPAPPGPTREPIVRIEAAAVGELSPPAFRALDIFSWEGDLRARIGSGMIDAVVAASFAPERALQSRGFQGTFIRGAGAAGGRVRWWRRGFELSSDLALVVEYEHYRDTVVHNASARGLLSPGLGATLSLATPTVAHLGAFVRLQAEWLPFNADVAARPQDFGATPLFWFGGAAGLLLDL
jgi:hypothetical protein